MEYELPYDFDLLFDIKTEEHLKRHYAQVKWEYEALNDMIKLHDIKGILDESTV
jgi:hypothetical protein